MTLQSYLAPLRSQGLVVFLTGAGVSAESGIPTFRGEEGYWTVGSRHYQPMELATQAAFSRMPEDVWSWYLYRRGVCHQAQPNPGHQVLARLEQKLGDRFLLITQNVDGLHLRAGNSPGRTYQIHGNIDYYRCAAACSTRLHSLEGKVEHKTRGQGLTDRERAELVCPLCGGPARPHVLWFDECYDEELYHFASSRQAAQRMAAFISLGSSGATNLPMQMAHLAHGRGIPMVDVNPERNPFSRLAEQSGGRWLRTTSSEALLELEEVWS